MRAAVCFASVIVLGGCGEIFGISCTSELRFNLVVEVRASLSGAPAAVITGRAYAPCTQLTPVAYRAHRELHVQLEPVEWGTFSCPNTTRLQQFEARYHLPQGNTYLLITNAFGEPVVLFDGVVSPTVQ